MFAHYLMMLGAIREESCTAPAHTDKEKEAQVTSISENVWERSQPGSDSPEPC